MSDQHRAKTALDIAVNHGFKFTAYEDGTTDYCDESGFVDEPEDLAGSIAEFFEQRLSTAVEALEDAMKFSELVECWGRTDCEIYKHELKGSADLSIERLTKALQSIKGNSDE